MIGKPPTNKRNIETQKYGERQLNFFGTNLWRKLPEKIRMSNTLEDFKREIKNWKPEKCFCYLCKNFIQDLGIAENLVITAVLKLKCHMEGQNLFFFTYTNRYRSDLS